MRSHPTLLPVLVLAAASWAAPKLPDGFIEKRIGSGLVDPVALAMAPDGTGFVAERDGRVYRIKGDTLVPQPVLSLAVDTLGDRGLIGLALDPAFPSVPKVYAVYFPAASAGGQLRLSGFPFEAEKLDPAREALVLQLPNPGGAVSGLGGGLACGADGKLYLGLGDLSQPELAQDLNAVNGKILRLNPNGFIPTDNPYYATGTGHGKAVWAAGFGDPVSLVFQPAGALHVHDAKGNGFQEVNQAVAAGNYGWPAVSGPSTDARFKAPLHAYPAAEGCGTRGGDFHVAGRGRFPAEYAGDYFTVDLCGGWMRRLLPSGERKDFLEGLPGPAALRFGPQGDLYYAVRGAGGGAYKLSYAPELAIRILAQPEDAAVQEGESVTFRVTVQGPPPIRYQWRKGGQDIAGATAASLTLASATLQDNGARFSVAVANDHGAVESRAAMVTVGKTHIAPKVVAQPEDRTVRVGQGATFSVVVDGSVPFSYRWNRKGVPIPGATAASYTLAATTLADNGADFFVEVSNTGGLVTSRRAVLTVVTTGLNPLADVHRSTVANGRGPVEGDMSNGESDAGDGDMLSIGDRLYARGLGTYANSEVALNLSAGCDSFHAEVGVDGEKGATGTVIFEVLADGISLYRGPIMTAASPPVRLSLVLTGRKELRLKVTDAGDQSGNDYANWADARIKCWENFSGIPEGRPRRAARNGWTYILGGGSVRLAAPDGRIHDLRGRMSAEYGDIKKGSHEPR